MCVVLCPGRGSSQISRRELCRPCPHRRPSIGETVYSTTTTTTAFSGKPCARPGNGRANRRDAARSMDGWEWRALAGTAPDRSAPRHLSIERGSGAVAVAPDSRVHESSGHDGAAAVVGLSAECHPSLPACVLVQSSQRSKAGLQFDVRFVVTRDRELLVLATRYHGMCCFLIGCLHVLTVKWTQNRLLQCKF